MTRHDGRFRPIASAQQATTTRQTIERARTILGYDIETKVGYERTLRILQNLDVIQRAMLAIHNRDKN